MAGTILLVVVAVFLVGGMCYQHWAAKKRTAQLALLARGMGFTFTERGTPDDLAEWSSFQLSKKASHRTIRNLMRGDCEGVAVAVFDYHSGAGQETVEQTVFTVRTAKLDLPRFELRPESVLDRLGELFGMKDVDFDEYPEFSRRFLLRGSDEVALRALFRSEVIRFFEQHEGLSVEGDGQALICYRPAKLVEPRQMEGFIRDSLVLYSLLAAR